MKQVWSGKRWRKGCAGKDCTKRAEGATEYCVAHGGGKRCSKEGCPKSAQGATEYCKAHGGGKRCESDVCLFYADPRDRGPARYTAPCDKRHGTVWIQKGTPLCFACLGSVFPQCVTLKVRQEHLILAEVQRLLPELEQWFEEWDCPVSGGCSLKRPDMLWEMPGFYLQLEVDEGGEIHEDNRKRLDEIHHSMGKHRPGVVIRINAKGMLIKKQHRDGELKYSASGDFKDAMAKVVDYIQNKILAKMGDDGMGVPECCTEGRVGVHKLLF